jgi:uncharacterized protein VirK/YbjX
MSMTHSNLDAQTAVELFRQTDNGSGGRLQTAKRLLKFRLRFWLCEKHLQRIRSFFHQQGLTELTHSELPVMLRPMRPYLWGGLNPEARTNAMLAHFEWMMSRHSPQSVIDFYKRGSYVYFSQTYPEGVITIELEPGRGLGREGEFELHLKFNGAAVMRAAFSILPAHMVGMPQGGFVMAIGNMQGQRFLNQEIKIVTQKMERTRPQNILMTALQGLASGWKLSAMVGVSDFAHVYSSYRSLSQRVGLSYDGLWEEMGTTGRLSKVHWQLPIEWVARSEQEVPSNKRSQLRRKNEIRQKIFDEVANNSAGL